MRAQEQLYARRAVLLASATVKLVTLTAALDEANSLAEPDRLRRVETTKPYTRDMAFELPP